MRNVAKILFVIYPYAPCLIHRIRDFIIFFKDAARYHIVAIFGIRCDILFHYRIFQQMNRAKLAAEFDKFPENGFGFRIGDAREVDFQEFFVFFAV